MEFPRSHDQPIRVHKLLDVTTVAVWSAACTVRTAR